MNIKIVVTARTTFCLLRTVDHVKEIIGRLCKTVRLEVSESEIYPASIGSPGERVLSVDLNFVFGSPLPDDRVGELRRLGELVYYNLGRYQLTVAENVQPLIERRYYWREALT